MFIRLFLLTVLTIGVAFSGYSQKGRIVSDDTSFIAAMLQQHNRYRSELKLDPLEWSPALAADALAWARHLAKVDKGQHDPEITGKEGENLWWGTANAFSYADMVNTWGNESQSFREGIFPDCKATPRAVVGHYTQIVWRNTRAVGCALAGNGRNDFLVCRYSPPGNLIGERPF